MVRCLIPARVHSPVTVQSGVSEKTGNAYSFRKCRFIDGDFNKINGTLSDDCAGTEHLVEGSDVTLVVDVIANGAFENIRVLEVRPVK